MRKVTEFKKIKAAIPEPSIAFIAKATSINFPSIGQLTILTADNETATAAFDKLMGEEFKGIDINLADIQDVAIFESAVLKPSN